MKFGLNFPPLIQKVAPGDMVWGIVAYSRDPWQTYASPEDSFTRYRVRLTLNLWLVILGFEWYQTERKAGETNQPLS